MIDVRNPTDVLVRIKRRSRRPRKGGGVPGATHELLVELSEAVGDSGPLEMGISPRRWLRAHEELNRAVQSLEDDRVEVQVADAERGLRAARRVFRLAAWSARWRKWFGGSRRALRIQVGALVLLLALVGAGGESLGHGDRFHPTSLVIGPLVAVFVWLFVGLDEATARRGDAALAREAARELAGRNRVLLAGRLARDPRTNGVRIAIATDQDVRVVRRPRRQRWGQVWCVPYTDITSFSSDEKAEPCHVTLDVGDRRLKLEYRWRLGEGRGDYQRAQRKALLAILERKTRAVAGTAGDGLGTREPRIGAAQLGE